MLVYSIMTIWIIRTHAYKGGRTYSPLHDLKIEYTQSIFQTLSQSPFAGEPSPEVDASWDELLAPMNIRVTKEELISENLESVALTEGGGYLSWTATYHQLHCINVLRKWIYREYYLANLTPSEELHIRSHVDHCVEFLRQSSLCKPDNSLVSFKWDPAETRPMFNATESEHTCVNWDTLVNSMSSRRVTEEEIRRLKNPLQHNAQ
ncbi:MAG: hypothetical protein LQ342_007884 [Letrouitia transgressa]|nr:MAG: hypothetical protein LQ342_007884 [Letrouitia transgressa]